MSKGNKKQRRELKRKMKRQMERRRESISPVKRLAAAQGEVECWISEKFELMGQLQAFVYKRGGGLAGIACFLVDRGVVGLKDAWVRMGVDRDEFDDALDSCKARGIKMRRSGIEEVRRWVAGGLRWAHENGMRLPKDWIRPASFIGGVGDWASADVSEFVMEFVGHPEDLRQRLIGQSFETYLKRTDVQIRFSDAAPYLDQETGEYIEEDSFDELDDDELDEEDLQTAADELPEEEINRVLEALNPVAAELAVETAHWLAGQSEMPSGELQEAWKSAILATMLSKSALPDAGEEEVENFGFELLQVLSSRIEGARVAVYKAAVEQVLRHLQRDAEIMPKVKRKHRIIDLVEDELKSR